MPGLNAQHLPLGPGVRLLKQDACGLLALEKPVGILSHPNSVADHAKSLLNLPYDMEARRYHGFDPANPLKELFLIHRLDSAATGVVLLCANAELTQAVKERFASQKVEKTYFAIVKGLPPSLPPVWIDRLEKVRKKGSRGGPVRARAGGGGAAVARTQQHRVRGDAGRAGLSLMRLSPQTGRTHQLRFQCSVRGYPILGDRMYGDFQLNRAFAKTTGEKRLFLHAAAISLSFQINGKTHAFEAESALPESFDAALAAGPALVRASMQRPGPHQAHMQQMRHMQGRPHRPGV